VIRLRGRAQPGWLPVVSVLGGVPQSGCDRRRRLCGSRGESSTARPRFRT